MLRMLFFAGIGVFIAGVLLFIIGVDSGLGWALGLGLSICIFSGVFIAIGKAVTAGTKVSETAISKARQEGRIGFAYIEQLSQTGTRINEEPVCELTLALQPPTGPAFRGKLKLLIPVIHLSDYQPGQMLEVAFFDPGHRYVGFTGGRINRAPASISVPYGSGAENIVRLKAAQVNKDGQLRTPLVGTGKRGRPLRFFAYLLAVVLGAGLLMLPYQERVANAYEAIAEGWFFADLRTDENVEHVIDEFEKKTGHRSAVSILVTNDYVIADLPTAEGRQETDSWMFKNAYAEHRGPTSIQPDSEREQFPLDEVNWESIWPAVQQASSTTGLPITDDLSIFVERSTISDIDSKDFIKAYGPVEIRFSLSSDYKDAYFRMDGDGTDLEMTGTS